MTKKNAKAARKMPVRACVGVFANNGRRDQYCRTCPKCILHLQALEGIGSPIYDPPSACRHKDKTSYGTRPAPNTKTKRTLNPILYRYD